MKNLSQELNDQLLDYIDGNLDAAGIARIEKEIQNNEAVKIRYDELKRVHEKLLKIELDQPSKNFTQLIMAKLEHGPVPSSFSIRNGVFILLGLLLTVGLAVLLVSTGAFDSSNTTLNLNQFDLPKNYLPKSLPSIQFNGKIVINIIIMANLGLAWIILDRLILKPYFQRRMQSHS